MKLINLGCGNRFHKDWLNFDYSPTSPEITHIDLREKLPFADNSIDCIYHSHVLEHFTKTDGSSFIKECNRVLKPGGIIRVAVPDLEQIAKEYLKNLETAVSGDDKTNDQYDWILIEMYDQTVRTKTGGLMLEFIQSKGLENKDYITNRCGNYMSAMIDRIVHEERNREVNVSIEPEKSHVESKIHIIMSLVRHMFNKGIRNYRLEQLKEIKIKKLLGNDLYSMYNVARFRNSGEIHYWMYDRFSLSRLLSDCGFQSPKKLTAFESQIPNWGNYFLDFGTDGSIYKRDSLFIEATKI